ncbi:MAG: transcriptional repressor [Saprospiraceae bacterium]
MQKFGIALPVSGKSTTFVLLMQLSRNKMNRRSTKTTQAVRSLLEETRQALSYEMIMERLPDPPNKATVYRILNRLCEDGFVHRILGSDATQYFAPCADCTAEAHHHRHFHFQCISCGKIECLDAEIPAAVPAGYQIADVDALISGQCRDC